MSQLRHSTSLLNEIDTQLLDKAKLLQEGRVSEKDTNVSTNNVGANILENAKQHQKGRAPLDGANAPNHNFTTK